MFPRQSGVGYSKNNRVLSLIYNLLILFNIPISTLVLYQINKDQPNNIIKIIMGEVTMLCKRTLISTKPAKPRKKITLSPLDLLMENYHIKTVYYYATPQGLEPEELTKKLRVAMSEMLMYFPIATGRMVKDDNGHWMIKCNDAGVRMVDATAKGSVQSWLQNVDEVKEKMLIHWEGMFHIPYFWATFYLKVTEFEEGGLAVGLGCPHFLADPISVALFMKAWADRTLLGTMLVPPFFHPLPQQKVGNHKPNTCLINHYKTILESPISSSAQTLKTITLAFTYEMVQSCMDLAQSNQHRNRLGPTPFSALSGLFWACISRVKKAQNKLIDMSLCIDARKVLGLDKGYFGNCMVYSKVQGHAVGSNELSQATMAIEEAMEKVDKEATMALIEWLECRDNCHLPLGGDLVIVNLENVDIYSSTFVENCKPIKVSYYVEPVNGKGMVLVFSPCSLEGQLGTTVMVTLPNDELVKLCEDSLLTRFSPTIVMGSNN